jgi:putative effector of murein hydrolase LrgA (UPF0299 family)
MIIATITVLSASFGRIVENTRLLPGADLFTSHLVPDLYLLLLFVPAVIHDLLRRGRVHRTYLVALLSMVAMSVFTHYLHYADWWLAIGRDVLR